MTRRKPNPPARPPRSKRPGPSDRVHLISPANPPGRDIERFGFADAGAYAAFVAESLPAPLRLTVAPGQLGAIEEPARGGRRDDVARVRDLQRAIADPRTAAIVATNGGAYLSRLLPQIDFAPLPQRRAAGGSPLAVLGFSEITGLVNLAAFHAGGRGVYWLCPNYLAWKVSPPAGARAAFAEFWRSLPRVMVSAAAAPREGSVDAGEPIAPLLNRPVHAEIVNGRVLSGSVRFVGGCLSVLAALLPGRFFRSVRPDGRWIVLEDVGEAPHRIDRHLAALQFAGWFERCAGVLVGDFHTPDDRDQRAAVVEFLRWHTRSRRDLPIALTRDFGHVWPMTPLPLNETISVRRSGRELLFHVEERWPPAAQGEKR